MARLILLIPVIAILFIGSTLAFSQGGPPGGGSPKVDIFAKELTNNAILVTWENPSDTADDIVFRYTVSREVNKTDTFVPIFDFLRNIDEKIIDETNGQEMFFYLDEDILPNTHYAYQISAGRTSGNPNPTLSDDTKPIFIHQPSEFTEIQSKGHLITGRTLAPITQIIWFDWFPFQLVQAEQLTNPIFTTSLNPSTESYRLALEPIPKSNVISDCTETLEFEYTKNDVKGQDFEVVVSIFEMEIQTDDDTGVEVSQEVPLLRHQKSFQNFTDSTKLRQKWQVIEPEDQQIHDYDNLEVQFDITGKQGDPRSISMWEVLFLVPNGVKAC